VAINLENPEVEALLKALAAGTGESLTEAAGKAFKERLEAVLARRKPGRERFLPEILQMIEQGRSLPVLDPRPTKELLDDLWGDA
jgi:antitoxin VapB